MKGTIADGTDAEFLRDTVAGLTSDPKHLLGKYLWDERGSQLFDVICGDADYYPTRQEMTLLPSVAAAVADRLGASVTIVEFGAGASRKIRTLLDALSVPTRYVAIDISRAYLEHAVGQLARDYPALEIVPTCVDYSERFALPIDLRGERVLGFFPGNSIGNVPPSEAEALLQRIRSALGPSHLLIGVDATQDEARLRRAYQDVGGRMSAFHKNVLVRMNRELGTDFDPGKFRHEARLRETPFRSEAHLVAVQATSCRLGERTIVFEPGESIRTDWSHKYLPLEFQALAERSGWTSEQRWIDEEGLFSMHLLRTQ